LALAEQALLRRQLLQVHLDRIRYSALLLLPEAVEVAVAIKPALLIMLSPAALVAEHTVSLPVVLATLLLFSRHRAIMAE
jgi:hypothetical protein